MCLIRGCINFALESEKGIFEAILRGNLDLKRSPWPSISDSAKDLIKKMLTRDPKRRITAFQALGEYKTLISSLSILKYIII